MTQTIETQRLIMRKPNAADWPAARDFYMSERSAMAGGHIDMGKAWRQFAAIIGHWEIRGYGLFAVTLKPGDQVMGLVGQWHPGDWPEAEIGWVMFDGAEGKSIAHEAAIAARHHAYSTLGWTTAVSYIDPMNARSIRLAERLDCTLDSDAQQPHPERPCLIYRHPTPATLDIRPATGVPSPSGGRSGWGLSQ